MRVTANLIIIPFDRFLGVLVSVAENNFFTHLYVLCEEQSNRNYTKSATTCRKVTLHTQRILNSTCKIDDGCLVACRS